MKLATLFLAPLLTLSVRAGDKNINSFPDFTIQYVRSFPRAGK